jgi:hypothetical protein
MIAAVHDLLNGLTTLRATRDEERAWPCDAESKLVLKSWQTISLPKWAATRQAKRSFKSKARAGSFFMAATGKTCGDLSSGR